MKKTLMLAAVVLMFSVAASAASITLNCSTGAGANSYTNSISCPQFNIGGQVLTGGTLNLVSGLLSLTQSFSTSGGSGTAEVTNVTGSWQAYGGGVALPLPLGPTAIAMSPTTGGPYTLPPNAAFGPSTGNAAAGSWAIGTLPQWTGAGNIVFSSEGNVVVSLTKTNNVDAVQDITWSSLWSVTYEYTPEGQVPEPGTFALLGGALVGLAALARRKK